MTPQDRESLSRATIDAAFKSYKDGNKTNYEALRYFMYPGELEELDALISEYEHQMRDMEE